MQIHISKDSDELSKEVAEWMVNCIKETLARQDRFTIALSGGSTPKKLFKLLSAEPYASAISWKQIHFFWGDERFVAYADERNNARMAFEELLDKVSINKEQVHVMRTELSPEEAVSDYDKILHQYFSDSTTSFDLVMLGLGDNAHTLSLFPGYPVIHESEKWVTAFYLKEQSMYRITLTAPIVNKSSYIIYLVAGADKAPAVQQIIRGEHNPDLYPAQVIQPERHAELIWFLDEAAGKKLQ